MAFRPEQGRAFVVYPSRAEALAGRADGAKEVAKERLDGLVFPVLAVNEEDRECVLQIGTPLGGSLPGLKFPCWIPARALNGKVLEKTGELGLLSAERERRRMTSAARQLITNISEASDDDRRDRIAANVRVLKRALLAMYGGYKTDPIRMAFSLPRAASSATLNLGDKDVRSFDEKQLSGIGDKYDLILKKLTLIETFETNGGGLKAVRAMRDALLAQKYSKAAWGDLNEVQQGIAVEEAWKTAVEVSRDLQSVKLYGAASDTTPQSHLFLPISALP